MRWILASASPRRRELLTSLLPAFEVIPSQADENVRANSPAELVEKLAKRKALEVAEQYPDGVVIGADTVVALGNEALGKPKDGADAFRMLSALSGRSHAVYTGVCILYPAAQGRGAEVGHAKTKVFFNDLSAEWIKEYIAGGSPMDKAGAYGIQDGGLVRKIEGSYTNVVGFPVELAKEMIERVKGNLHD